MKRLINGSEDGVYVYGKITVELYGKIIDGLVEMCQNGQGKVYYDRVLSGEWYNDRMDFNELLSKLSTDDRKILAEVISDQISNGVFEALKVLEESGIEPFNKSYEGSCFNDFIGRMIGWEWPDREREL